jgi:hypothetical protein
MYAMQYKAKREVGKVPFVVVSERRVVIVYRGYGYREIEIGTIVQDGDPMPAEDPVSYMQSVPSQEEAEYV